MKYWLLFGFLFAFSASYSQKSPVKFGEIPLEDMKMTVYDKDSSAAAVILVDYGEAYISITPPVKMSFERHVRIKILNKNGLDWATSFVRLYHSAGSDEKVTNLKASTYNLEGGKIVETKMDKDAFFKEKFSKYINHHKFTLPNVKEGSVIEYSYKVLSDFFTYFPNWQFQYSIPVRHSEYWAIIPSFFTYEKYMQGYLTAAYNVKTKTNPDYTENGHHWLITDVPAFKEEPHMTSEDDYLSKINFALAYLNFPGQPVKEIMGTWAKLNEELLEAEDFGGTIRGSGFLKKEVAPIIAGITDPAEKAKAIYNYVSQNFAYDGTEDFEAGDLKKVFETKKGTSGDLNLLLASMLEKADVAVDPVLLSTRDHGFVREQYPMSRQFNYVVCLVRLPDNKTMWLDASAKYLPPNILPKKCLNGSGLVISEKNHGWISLDTKTKAKTTVSANLVLSPSGELSGKVDYLRDGYDAHSMRNDYLYEGQDSYLKKALGSKTWTISNTTFDGIKDISSTAKETHELSIADHATVSGDVIYINPFITSRVETSPFVLDKRTYPIDYGSRIERTYMLKLTVPAEYQVEELPQPKVLALPENGGKFLYNIVQTGNTITVTSNFQINKNLFVQDEYPVLKEFYNQVVAKQAEQIVLRKK